MADDDVDTRFGSGATVQLDDKRPATVTPSSVNASVDSMTPGRTASPPADTPPLLGTSWSNIVGDMQRYGEAGIRGLGLGTRDVVQGAVGQLGDILSAPGRAMGLGSGTPSQDLDRALTAAGLPKPQNEREQWTSKAVQGGASALPYMLAGAVPALGAAAPLIASRLAPATGGALTTQGVMGAGGAVAGETAQRELPAWTPDWARPVAGLLGNVAGAMTVGGLASGVGRLGNVFAGKANEIYDALGRLGINRNLVGTVSEDPTAQLLEAASGKSAVGSTIMQPERQRVMGQFGNAVEDTASQFGPHSTADAAGTTLQDQARQWITDTFPNKIEAPAWEPVNRALAGTTVTPTNYRTTLENLVNPPGSSAAQQPFMPKAAQTWLDKLNESVPQDGTGTMTWDQAKQLRSAIGSAMGTPEIVQSVGMDNLKRAYGGIANDMRTTAVDNGGGAAFDNANLVSTTGHHFIESTLRNVVRANNPAQENITATSAANNILGGDSAKLQAVRDNLPDAADALAAYQLRQIAQAKPSAQTGKGGDTSTESFLTGMEQMRQRAPDGTNALFNTGSDPLMAQRLRDLSLAAGALRATNKAANTSGTSPTSQILGAGGLGALGLLQGGLKGGSIAIGAPLLWNAAMSAAARNPAVARYMAAPAPTLPSAWGSGALSNVPSDWQRSQLQPAD